MTQFFILRELNVWSSQENYMQKTDVFIVWFW